MKRTVSCEVYITGKLLTNPTPFVTKGLNLKNVSPEKLEGKEKGGKADGATRQPFKKWRIE